MQEGTCGFCSNEYNPVDMVVHLRRCHMDGESIETVVQMDAYTWEWVDIGGTRVQVRLDPEDFQTTFRFRLKPLDPNHWSAWRGES